MNLPDYLRNHKDEIHRLWTDAVYSSCPFDDKGLLRTVSDPFGNPGGDMIREAAQILLTAVCGEETAIKDIRAALERFIKLRAVQQNTPSRALGVFYLLKPIMRELVLPRCETPEAIKEYLAAESRVDSLALLAFDIYMEAREILAESRVREIRARYAQVERWAQTFKKDPFIAE
jgi:hypothetical protein